MLELPLALGGEVDELGDAGERYAAVRDGLEGVLLASSWPCLECGSSLGWMETPREASETVLSSVIADGAILRRVDRLAARSVQRVQFGCLSSVI